jgi:hypothetical protein
MSNTQKLGRLVLTKKTEKNIQPLFYGVKISKSSSIIPLPPTAASLVTGEVLKKQTS